MTRYQLPDGNIVIADSDFIAAHHPGAVVAPDLVPDPPAPVFARLTKLGFRGRLSQAEKTAIELASLDDPSATLAQRQQAADIRVYLADVAAATYIDPQHVDTRSGVQALEAAGLIGAGRALEILDAPVQADESYLGPV